MKIRRLFSMLAPLTLVASLAAAQSPAFAPVGGEIRVNTTTAQTQSTPDVAMDDAGNFVVVWSGGPFFGNREIFAQRFNASGTPLGSEFQVNTFTSTEQSNPRVGMDADGDFVVIWMSESQFPPAIFSVIGQRFDETGAPVGNEFLISPGVSVLFPEVAMGADGAFLVTGIGRPESSFDFGNYVWLYDSAGTPQATSRLDSVSFEAEATVTAAPGGGWIAIWTSNADILAQRLDANGNLVGPEVAVQPPGGGFRQDVNIAASSDRIVVSWTDYTGNAGSARVQLFDDGFSPLTGEIQPSTLPTQPIQESAVAMDGAGRFVTAWIERDLEDNNENVLNPTRDGSDASFLARAFDAAGNPLGSDFVVNTTAEGFQAAPRLAMSSAGRLVATWVGPGADFEDDIFAQVYGGPNATPEARCRNLTVSVGPVCTAGASIDNGSFDPDGADSITLAQSPAGPYALGTTLVTLTVTDNHGAASSCTGIVTVTDTIAPDIICPDDIVTDGSLGSGGAVVSYTVVATDPCGTFIDETPPSGSFFPFGTTPVYVTATDDALNSSGCGFNVTVLTPEEQITATIDEIEALIAEGTLTSNKANPLIQKLEGAAAKLDAGNVGAACNQLGAFINQVNAYIGNGTLTAAQGQELIDSTNTIRTNIGC